MRDRIIGREAELAAVGELLGRARSAPAALLLEGQAGAGKSTIWNEAVVEAAALGFRVLACRPGRNEVKLSFSALDDLLAGVVDDVAMSLPEPQRRALDAVLLREGGREAVDARTVSRAVLETVRLLAASSPIALAVDDGQWMDRPSEGVLEYVLRRLAEEPVAVLLAWRGEKGDAPLFGLDRSSWEGRVSRLSIGALSVAALHGVVQLHVGVSLSRQLLLRVHDASGGNPFFAVEIVRAVVATGRTSAPDEPLPIPAVLSDLVESRITRLPIATREVLLVASALADPTMRVLKAAEGESKVTGALERAVRAGVLVVDRDRVEFTHPLLASGVYGGATPWRRAAVHRRLVDLVADDEEKARHLGLATDDPDAAVADSLDRASALALARGAPSIAAEFSEHAEKLTPRSDSEGARRRCLNAARCYATSGDAQRGRELVERLAATSPPGATRAEALLLLGGIDLRDDVSRALDVLAEALREASDDPVVAARVLRDLCSVHLGRWDVESAAVHAQSALAMAERNDDVATLASALVVAGRLEVIQGHAHGIALVERAASMQSGLKGQRIASLPSGWLGTLSRWADDFDGSRRRLEPLLRQADETGDDASVGELLYELSELERWAGNWDLATRYAQQSVEIHSLADRQWELAAALATLSAVEAHLGRADASRRHAEQGLDIARSIGGVDEEVRNLHALGFLELSLSRFGPALDHLSQVAQITAAVKDPGILRFAGDHVEALLGVGALDAAEEAIDRLESEGQAVGRSWALAVAARCRALLLSARGDLDRAIAVVGGSLAYHNAVPMPFERARTVLVAGMVGRRARRTGDARRALMEARDSFERLGASLWADKAASELAKIGGRAPSPLELTPGERQIVQLVAAGRSNPEVAAELFMSRRTVEDHLSRIYRKLGVRSRTELAHQVARQVKQPEP